MVSTVRFFASDLSMQKKERISAPVEARVGDYTEPLLERLRLPSEDSQGNSLSYRWRNHTQGILLGESDRIGAVVQEDDHVLLMGEPVAG